MLTDQHRAFIEQHASAAMVTVGTDGAAKVARVGIAVVDGRLWSSGTAGRVRTRRLRQDPRCTLVVFEAGPRWLTLETVVTILDGPDAPELNLRLFRQMQGRPSGRLSWFGGEHGTDDFLRLMAAEERLIYDFEVRHAYGMT